MAITNISIVLSMSYMLFITILSLIKQKRLIIDSKNGKIFRIVMILIGVIFGSLIIYTWEKSFDVVLGLGLFIEFYRISKLKQGIYEDGFLTYIDASAAWSQLKKVEIYNKTHELHILYYDKRSCSDLVFEKKNLNLILQILREHLDEEIIKVINKI